MIHRTTPAGHDPTLRGSYETFACEIAAPRNVIWSEKVFRLIQVSGEGCKAIWYAP